MKKVAYSESKIDFNKLLEKSTYFRKNESAYRNLNEIDLNCPEVKNQKVVIENINVFIDYINSDSDPPIDVSNASILYLLSTKYQVQKLKDYIDKSIQKLSKEDILSILIEKAGIQSEFKKFIISKNEETVIASNFLSYIKDDNLHKKFFDLPLAVIDRIIKKYINLKPKQNKSNEQIINFLFECLHHYDRDASILFNYIDIDSQIIKRISAEYKDNFDFNVISTNLINFYVSKIDKLHYFIYSIVVVFILFFVFILNMNRAIKLIISQNIAQLMNKQNEILSFTKNHYEAFRETINGNMFNDFSDESKSFIIASVENEIENMDKNNEKHFKKASKNLYQQIYHQKKSLIISLNTILVMIILLKNTIF